MPYLHQVWPQITASPALGTHIGCLLVLLYLAVDRLLSSCALKFFLVLKLIKGLADFVERVPNPHPSESVIDLGYICLSAFQHSYDLLF